MNHSRQLRNMRAWSTLTVKSVDEEIRTLTGVASTPSTDRVGDIVEPRGALFKLPLPLLSQHDHASPIGHVIDATVTDGGIKIIANIVKDSGLSYVEKAWKQIKAGLVRGLSIGYRPLDVEPLKGGGYRLKKWEWFELSAVTIPAQAEATISAVKALDVLGLSPEEQKLIFAGASKSPALSAVSGTHPSVQRALDAREAVRALLESRL